MLKEGKYRAFRNIPAGWLLQALHSTDKSEFYFRIVLELIFLTAMSLILLLHLPVSQAIIISFLFIHTIMWFLTGNFWVYMLDSFKFIHNPGIYHMIEYVTLCRKIFTSADSCDAILIYGSMCRKQFHGRSDLDLRVIRRTNSIKGFYALIIGFYLRSLSFIKIIPVDLEVVDSKDFIDKQMRDDEIPIIVYRRNDYNQLDNRGIDFDLLQSNPQLVLKSAVSTNK